MRTARKKLALFSVSAGAGHVRAAQALEAAAERWRPDLATVHVDLMDLVPKLFRKVYVDSYLKVVEHHPAFWGQLYAWTDRERVDSAFHRLRVAVERLNTQKLKRLLAELSADHLVCTHFLPAQLLSGKIARGSLRSPLWVQVTDFDVHAMWVHEHVTGYFAAGDEVAWRMEERGIQRERIRVTGIPVMPAFGDPLSREACARGLGLDPGRRIFALMAGGAGVGGLEKLAERLLALPGDFQLVALAGRNEELLADLRALAAAHPGRLTALGFTREVERVLGAADLAITKPGGLTTSECLAVGVPMIAVSPIPGQEERNADYLLEHGAALKACDLSAVAYRVKALLEDPGRLAAMTANAKRLGRPGAARDVLAAVVPEAG